MCIISPSSDYYQLESERLLFRSLTRENIPEWIPFFDNNPTLRFLGFHNSIESGEEIAEQWISVQIERQVNNQFGQLAIYQKDSQQFIGVAGIISRELKGERSYEITYSLLPDSWGKGFATEAAQMLKNFLFKKTKITTAISIIHIENNASINVAKKNGMVISKESMYKNMEVYIFKCVKP